MLVIIPGLFVFIHGVPLIFLHLFIFVLKFELLIFFCVHGGFLHMFRLLAGVLCIDRLFS